MSEKKNQDVDWLQILGIVAGFLVVSFFAVFGLIIYAAGRATGARVPRTVLAVALIYGIIFVAFPVTGFFTERFNLPFSGKAQSEYTGYLFEHRADLETIKGTIPSWDEQKRICRGIRNRLYKMANVPTKDIRDNLAEFRAYARGCKDALTDRTENKRIDIRGFEDLRAQLEEKELVSSRHIASGEWFYGNYPVFLKLFYFAPIIGALGLLIFGLLFTGKMESFDGFLGFIANALDGGARGLRVFANGFQRKGRGVGFLVLAALVGITIWQFPEKAEPFLRVGLSELLRRALLVFTSITGLVLVFDWFFLMDTRGRTKSKHGNPLLLGSIEKTLFGQKEHNFDFSDDQYYHHMQVLGTTGSGKSVFLRSVLFNQILKGAGLFFIDLKSDLKLLCDLAAAAKISGRLDSLKVFSINENLLDVSLRYSSFLAGNASELKDKVMGAFSWSEEYYKKRAESFLLKAFIVLTHLRDKRGREITFFDLYSLLQSGGFISELKDEIEDGFTRGVCDELAAMLKDKKELEGLRSDLENLVLSDFRDLLRGAEINLFESYKRGDIVYILLDSQRYADSAKRMGKLIVQDIKTLCGQIRGSIPEGERKPFLCVVDEFADLATENMAEILSRARDVRVGVIVCHQEISDLTRISPEFRDQVMQLTNTTVVFKQKGHASAELLAKSIGTRTTEKRTFQEEDGLLGSSRTGMTSVREVEEFLVHPNDLKRLETGECYVHTTIPVFSLYHARTFMPEVERIPFDKVKVLLKGIVQKNRKQPIKQATKPVAASKEPEKGHTW